MLLYWYHFAHHGKRIDAETDDDSVGGHFLHLLHEQPPSAAWVRAMHTSLILYAEHEFNASTFTARVIAGTGSDMYSAITGAIGALRGPKHGGANEARCEIQQRYATPDEAEADIRAAAGATRKSSSASATRSTRMADPRNQIDQGGRAPHSCEEAGDPDACSRSPSGSRRSCGMPSACSPTSTGTRRSATT